MNSRKISFIRRAKEWITESKADNLVALLDTTTDAITIMGQAATAPPACLIDALREPPGQATVTTIPLPQMSVTVAIFPTGSTGAARESALWNTIKSRSWYWSRRAEDAHRMQRERLDPEIGGMRITTASGSTITILNSEYSHKTGIAVLRAIKTGVMLPVAIVADSMTWVSRRARERPLSTVVLSTAVAAGLAFNTAEAGDPRQDPLPVRPPLTAHIITVPATVTRTATVAPRERSTARPAPRGPAETPETYPTSVPTATPTTASRTRRPAPTPLPAATGSGHTPAARIPGTATPPPSGAPPATDITVPEPRPTGCGGIVHVGATVNPLLGVDVCLG